MSTSPPCTQRSHVDHEVPTYSHDHEEGNVYHEQHRDPIAGQYGISKPVESAQAGEKSDMGRKEKMSQHSSTMSPLVAGKGEEKGLEGCGKIPFLEEYQLLPSIPP